MLLLGIIIIFLFIIYILREVEKNRLEKTKELKKVRTAFESEMFAHAKQFNKIAKGYVVDSETEGGEWVQITSAAEGKKLAYLSRCRRLGFDQRHSIHFKEERLTAGIFHACVRCVTSNIFTI